LGGSSDNEAIVPSAEQAPHQQAWFPSPDGDAVGPRGAIAATEEGTEAADRLAAIEARRILTRLRACRGRTASRARRTFAAVSPMAVAAASSMWT
jgi:hypothetical protein